MQKLMVAFALLVMLVPSVTHALGAPDQCDDLEAYFGEVDNAMAEEVLPLLQDAEWRAQLQRSVEKASHSEMSILVLSPEEMEPFIRLLATPGDALLGIPDAEVPLVARDLHESALQTWLLYPAMLRAVSSGGLFGALIYVEEIEELNAANLDAQAEVSTGCPDQVATAKARSERAADSNTAVDFDDPDAFTNIEPADFEGIAYNILFVASEDANDAPAGAPGIDENAGEMPESGVQQTPVATSVPAEQAVTPAIVEPIATFPVKPTPPIRRGGPTADELLGMLPAADALPVTGLDRVEDSSLTKEETVDALGGSHGTEVRLDEWGWSANATRSYIAPDPSKLDPSATTNITISLHGFDSDEAAAEALPYFSDVLVNLGYQEVDTGDIGVLNRMITQQQEDGGMLVALYLQRGPILYRIGGYSPAGDPTGDVLKVAERLLNP